MRIAIVLCVFFTTSVANSQSDARPDVPGIYAGWLKPVSARDQSNSEDYLVYSDSEPVFPARVLRRLVDGWSIIRFDENNSNTDRFEIGHPVNGLWKLSDPDILNRTGDIWLTLKLGNGAELSSLSCKSFYRMKGSYARVEVNGEQLMSLINNTKVLYIGFESKTANEESRVLDLNLNFNTVHRVHAAYPELKGSGLTIGVKEDRFDEDDIDLAGRTTISAKASETASNHATEMATIIGGAGNTFTNGLGVATEVQMISSGFGNLMPENESFYENYEMTVQNHSYGGELESFYGASAEAFDISSNQDPYLLHLMSSGNSGLETPSSGAYSGLTGWANLTGNYKNAKNSLVVGAVDTTGVLSPFSSVGPTADGRIKPELVAYSTAGTSNAAALVSGTAILLQEAYQNANDEKAPSSLIKALLMNGARDVGEEGPDFKTGFGNVDAYSSMEMLDKEYYYHGRVESNQTIEIPISLPDDVFELKITLVWNDPAANANDQQTLVNDLDLRLVDPDDSAWLPWVLDPSANEEALSTKAIRDVDDLNNAEQITLDAPIVGDYTIEVTGDGLIEGEQAFSVVYNYQLRDSFEWNYPLAGSFMPYDGESGSYFRWVSTHDQQVGELSISLDNGATWEVLDEAVDLTKGYWRWLPNLPHSQAIARMKTGSKLYQTEPFVISNSLPVYSGFDCGDSLMIVWPKMMNVDEYEIYRYEDQKLELWNTVEDTFAILNGATFKSGQLRVVPTFQDGTAAIGSYIFRSENLGTDCYISSFFGFSVEEGVSLNGDLTSIYNLSHAHFQHLKEAHFENIYSSETPHNQVLEFVHGEPYEGVNYYRLQLELENGASIISDTLGIYYLNEMIAMVYPNPVQSGEQISLRTNARDGLASRIEIFDYKGNLLLETEISELEFLRINGGLPPGIYHYRVSNASGVSRGKIVVY